MWKVLALSAIAEAPEAIAGSRERAVQWLQGAGPGVSTESLFLNFLMARQLGQTNRASELLKILLAEQKPDGGWSWRRDHTRSDAMTTGQVLWALSIVGGHPEAVACGRRYLVDTQNVQEPGPSIKGADLANWQILIQPAAGSWLMSCRGISKIKTRTGVCDAMYQYWAPASWAVIGVIADAEAEVRSDTKPGKALGLKHQGQLPMNDMKIGSVWQTMLDRLAMPLPEHASRVVSMTASSRTSCR